MIEILAIASLGIGIYIIGFNWYSIYATYKLGRHISFAPIVGAVLFGIGLLGFEQTKQYVWTSIFVDIGTLSLILTIPTVLMEIWRTSRFNLVYQFTSDTSSRHYNIKLFKRDTFVIDVEHKTQESLNSNDVVLTASGLGGTWRQKGKTFYLEKYMNDCVLIITKDDNELTTKEISCDDSKEPEHLSLDKLRLKQVK